MLTPFDDTQKQAIAEAHALFARLNREGGWAKLGGDVQWIRYVVGRLQASGLLTPKAPWVDTESDVYDFTAFERPTPENIGPVAFTDRDE